MVMTGARAVALVLCLLTVPGRARAADRTVDDYRHFRALTIDLLGRIPSGEEIAAFERPDFDVDAWIDKQLNGPGYVDRMTRIYMDLLRLEVPSAVVYAPQAVTLRRARIVGPSGKPIDVYFRANQRRARAETDGEFCLSPADVGAQLIENQWRGTLHPVSRQALEANTVVVRPWWLYRDYADPQPMLLYNRSWGRPDALYHPVDELLVDADGRPTVDVLVCREEAQTADTGTIYVSGRDKPTPGQPPPLGRARPLPLDDRYAIAHRGESVSCRSALALGSSIDCGCGVGLERCLPGADASNDPRAFVLPAHAPLGIDRPFDSVPQSLSAWNRLWWSQEAQHFLAYLFGSDRDFREVLRARYSMVNGPLAHFYRVSEPGGCCTKERALGLVTEAEPLFDPRNLPPALGPWDASTWRLVPNRGPHAAGLLTMPAFLTKFASRRARAAILYQVFQCRSFVAADVPLAPSTEPNLMVRPGCSACHAALEPLAAYFARVEETSWVYLPAWQFPLRNLACHRNKDGKLPGFCDPFYDSAFSDETAGLLRGAYAAIDHAAAGPVGAAEAITRSPEFAACATERVTSSFLGRPLGGDDAPLLERLTAEFVRGGYRMRTLVRAILRSDVYRRANDAGTTP
jgi:hypothetical protein